MRRVLVFFTVVTFVAFLLVGCGKSELDNYLSESMETVNIMEYNYEYINYVKGQDFLSIDDVEDSYLVVFTHPEYVASLTFVTDVLPRYVESVESDPYKIYLVNLSFKEHKEIWEDYQLQVLPTTFLIQRGSIRQRITGFVTEEKLPFKGDLPENKTELDEDENGEEAESEGEGV